MSEEIADLKHAECCRYCANTTTDYHFRDAVLCFKYNKYSDYTDTCPLFKEK